MRIAIIWAYGLYLFHFDIRNNLLFINSNYIIPSFIFWLYCFFIYIYFISLFNLLHSQYKLQQKRQNLCVISEIRLLFGVGKYWWLITGDCVWSVSNKVSKNSYCWLVYCTHRTHTNNRRFSESIMLYTICAYACNFTASVALDCHCCINCSAPFTYWVLIQ